MYSIQALLQTSFDGEWVHFEMRCLFCDKVYRIKETLDDCLKLKAVEKEVLNALEDERIYPFLSQLVREGKTYPFHITDQK